MSIAAHLITLNLASLTLGLAEFRMQACSGLALSDCRCAKFFLIEPTGRCGECTPSVFESEVPARHGANFVNIPALGLPGAGAGRF